MDTGALIQLAYVVAAVLFILGLKNMSHPRTAVRGNRLGATGMLLAILVTMLNIGGGVPEVADVFPAEELVG